MKTPPICDLYGNYCFRLQTTNPEVIENCTKICPSDCEDVRFSITEREVPINVHELCDGTQQDGYSLTYKLLRETDYFPLYYGYHKMEQMAVTNRTTELPLIADQMKEECNEIMKNDISIVKVRMETNNYITTIKSKRLTFADKLAFFGRL